MTISGIEFSWWALKYLITASFVDSLTMIFLPLFWQNTFNTSKYLIVPENIVLRLKHKIILMKMFMIRTLEHGIIWFLHTGVLEAIKRIVMNLFKKKVKRYIINKAWDIS